jgi:hypothetical protein
MAGLGRKVFSPGEVLTATNVQNYLMDQAVQVYASEAARGSAIGSATTEGMVSWLSDTDQMQVAVGTATWQDVSLVQSPNYVINGGFDVWQRGTAAVTTNGLYSADRWIIGSSAGTNSVTRSTDVPTGTGVAYSISFAGTSTTNPRIRQRIESANSLGFAGKTVTLSFYAKSTSGTGAIKVDTAYPTTTADTFGTWASPTTTADQSGLEVLPTGNASTSWTWYSVTFAVNSLASRGYQIDLYRETSTASSTTLFAGVQLELGFVATPFKRNGSTLQAELAACQRYYYRAEGAQIRYGFGFNRSTTITTVVVPFPVTMRREPTALEQSGTAGNYAVAHANTGSSCTAVPTFRYATTLSSEVTFTTGGLTTGQGSVGYTDNTSGYLGWSAEL